MRPSNVPQSATPFPLTPGPFPEVQKQTVDSIQHQVDVINAVALGVWNVAKNNWLQAAERDRELGIAIRPKPVQPATYVLNVVPELNPDGTPNGILWLWNSDGAPLGEPCPDLPPAPTPIDTTPVAGKIGIAIPGGNGEWFQCLPGDTTPVGAVFPGVSKDGVAGLFKKVGSAVGGGWFQKVG